MQAPEFAWVFAACEKLSLLQFGTEAPPAGIQRRAALARRGARAGGLAAVRAAGGELGGGQSGGLHGGHDRVLSLAGYH